MNGEPGGGVMSTPRRLANSLLIVIFVVLAGGFAAAALVRYSPGFDSIPEDLDPAISPETLRALHEQHARRNFLPVFYARYLASAARGDLGVSEDLKLPVEELILDRAPATLKLIAGGTAFGWAVSALLAWAVVWGRRSAIDVAASAVSGVLLAVPPAVLGLAFFFANAPLMPALGLALVPRLFGTLRALLEARYSSGPVVAARARGMKPHVLAWRYVVMAEMPQLAALAGAGLVTAFGASIAIETLCGVPGVGALALHAALSRDMPLLCGLALGITFFVTAAQAAGDLVRGVEV
jgi:peptide/nickel transport system permease protein